MNDGVIGGLTNLFLKSIQNICSDQSKDLWGLRFVSRIWGVLIDSYRIILLADAENLFMILSKALPTCNKRTAFSPKLRSH